jgi:hypothetical protein
LRFVPNAILFLLESKNSWIQAGVLAVSREDMAARHNMDGIKAFSGLFLFKMEIQANH